MHLRQNVAKQRERFAAGGFNSAASGPGMRGSSMWFSQGVNGLRAAPAAPSQSWLGEPRGGSPGRPPAGPPYERSAVVSAGCATGDEHVRSMRLVDLEKENAKLKDQLRKYKSRWDRLKASAKRKKKEQVEDGNEEGQIPHGSTKLALEAAQVHAGPSLREVKEVSASESAGKRTGFPNHQLPGDTSGSMRGSGIKPMPEDGMQGDVPQPFPAAAVAEAADLRVCEDLPAPFAVQSEYSSHRNDLGTPGARHGRSESEAGPVHSPPSPTLFFSFADS